MDDSLSLATRVAHEPFPLAPRPLVPHAPGTTKADSDYRNLEQLFSASDLQDRHRILMNLGIELKYLPDDVYESTSFIGQAEGGLRLLSKRFKLAENPELDGVATLLRISRSLAQRRNRGHQCRDLGFLDATNSLLHKLNFPPCVIAEWNNSISALSGASPAWDEGQIRAVAQTLPMSMVVQYLGMGNASIAPLNEIFRSGTAVDWMLHDLGLNLSSSPQTGHVAPISDMLANVGLQDNNRIGRVLSILDYHAQILDRELKDNKPLPDFVSEYFVPVRKLLTIVVSGLAQRGLL